MRLGAIMDNLPQPDVTKKPFVIGFSAGWRRQLIAPNCVIGCLEAEGRRFKSGRYDHPVDEGGLQ
jgi:hypothetical protein